MSESKETIWQRSPDVAFVDDAERVVILSLSNPRASRPQLLTGSAAAIWRALDGLRSCHDIATLISADSSTDSDQVAQDVNRFLQDLGVKSLVAPAQEL